MKHKLTKRFRRFFLSKRGVNVVISTVMLACAVVALGFVVLYWAQQRVFEANARARKVCAHISDHQNVRNVEKVLELKELIKIRNGNVRET